ncbi:roadblock/LC7 domain-containing protein [Acinetobacter sp. ME22]|uniref:roadblock/LC7 domain-containing protein n=1 Tax=Acinetobacter sp. ME22 TaxID=2904802 RepID=UPI001EDAC5B0|nr:roadblock/LC7 domain-containing protein [Acinetobacter sp. ME22]MCG2573256.1 roadblock/LC7 domain-containing protein [Acinetobacter sp. ME22]
MNFNQSTISSDFIDFSQKEISNLLNRVNHIQFCMLCTTDGLEIATASKTNWNNMSKIAAVSSSIMALISAFITEMHLDECQTIMLDTANGKALLTTITHQQFPSVLVVLTQKQVLLGEMFYELKNTCEHFLSFRSVAA